MFIVYFLPWLEEVCLSIIIAGRGIVLTVNHGLYCALSHYYCFTVTLYPKT